MHIQRRILICSASAGAILAAAAPAMAASPAGSTDTTVSEIVVTGIKASLQRAIEVKKVADDQVDAISAEDIGKLPDRNVADALQRIPGINTSSTSSGEGGFDEHDRVSIRGTSPSLTQVTIDGHSVATGDWFLLDQFQTVGRSVSFTLLPAEIVSGTTVYKTQDASLLEGGVAGVVDLQTLKPLSFGKQYTVEASAEAAYNSNSGQTKPQVSGLIAWKNDADTFGILAQGFYEDRSVERFGQETLGYTAITSAMPVGAAHPSLIGVEAPTLIGSTLFKQERTREGGDLALQYRPNDRFELDLTGFYSHMEASNVNDNYMYWGSHELATNTPTSYTVANNTLTSAVWPAGQDSLVVDGITRPQAYSETYFINLDGKFQVSDKLTFRGEIGYTQGIGDTPQAPSFEVDGGMGGISYAPSGNGWVVTPVGVNPQSPAGLANDWAWNETFRALDTETYGQIDGDYEVDHGVFRDVKFGVHIADHTRQVDGWDRGCTLGANGACWGSPTMPFSAVNPVSYPSGFSSGNLGIPGLLIPIAGNPSAIDNIINAIPGGVRGPVSAIKQPQNYYWMGSFKVQETDTAGYVMAKVGGDGWRGNFGVRIVNTDENDYVNSPSATTNSTYVTTSAFGNYYIDHIQHNYLDILPSLNFTFDLQKNLFLRLSAAETMSRPDYSALGGTVSLTDLTLTGNGGNANLKPIKAAVYDASLEWYYTPTGVAAISVFYDDLSSYVTYGVSQGVYKDQLLSGPSGPPVYSTYSISSPTNIAGSLNGVELQVQQPLPLGFGFQANFTYVDGADAVGNPLVGTSRETLNLVGYYENKWVNARLAYTYRSHFYVGLDRSSAENETGNGELDASVNFTVTPNVTISIDGLNLTNQLLKYYAQNPTQVRAVYDNGSQYYAGVHVKF